MHGLFLSAVLALVCLSITSEAQNANIGSSVKLVADFQAHVEKFSLNYTGEEYNTRRSIFNGNVAAINLHNEEAAQGVHTYTEAIGPFTHMTKEEFIAYASSGRSKVPRSPELLAIHERMPIHPAPSPEALLLGANPSSVDWRNTAGVVTPVKNQGQCGSCWTFSASGGLEGAYALMTSPPSNAGPTSTLDSGTGFYGFSEQQLNDCDTMSSGCNGGFVESAYIYASQGQRNGLTSEKLYPYLNVNTVTTASCQTSLEGNPIAGTATDPNFPYTIVTPGSVSAMESAVARQPVTVAVQATGAIQNYAGGIITAATCGQDLDHAVLVVGYNTDSASGMQYWIVKNSWTATWGNSGYFYVEKSALNACGILSSGIYPNILGAGVLPTQSPTPPPNMPPPSSYYTVTGYMTDSAGTSPTKPTSPPLYTAQGIVPLAFDMTITWPSEFATPQVFTGLTLYSPPGLTATAASVYMAGGVTLTNSFNVKNNYLAFFQGTVDASGIVQFVGMGLGKTSWNGPINSLSVFAFLMGAINQGTADPAALIGLATTTGATGVLISNVKFTANLNAPTPSPTFPPAPSGSIIDSLVQTYYSDFSCTMPVVDLIIPMGMCEYDGTANAYVIKSHDPIPVVNPGSPVNVNYIVNSYNADSTCTSASTPYMSNTVTLKQCALDTYSGIYSMSNIVAAVGRKAAGPTVSNPVGLITYVSSGACQSQDATQVSFQQFVSSGACISGTFVGQSKGTSAIVTAPCSSTVDLSVNIYSDSKCQTQMGSDSKPPGCSGSFKYGYEGSTCPALSSNINASGSSKTGAIAGGVAGAIVVIAVILYCMNQQSKATATVAAAAAATTGVNKAPTSNPINPGV